MQSLEDGKYNLLMRKNYYYSFKKKTGMFQLTWPQSQYISSFGTFQTFSVFQQYKKENISVIINFRKQCLTEHVQRLPFTMGSKWWPKNWKV